LLQLTFFLTTRTTLAVVHISATKFFLYWKYLWFDIPMHFLGGVCVALGLSALPFFRIHVFERFRTPLIYASVTLLVGILWEIFEVTSGIMVIDETFVPDTVLDLVMDVLGGLVGYAVAGTLKKL
jgi:hypothetical protein